MAIKVEAVQPFVSVPIPMTRQSCFTVSVVPVQPSASMPGRARR